MANHNPGWQLQRQGSPEQIPHDAKAIHRLPAAPAERRDQNKSTAVKGAEKATHAARAEITEEVASADALGEATEERYER